eukprot:883410-Pelagomonas_calceolata.AAC.2
MEVLAYPYTYFCPNAGTKQIDIVAGTHSSQVEACFMHVFFFSAAVQLSWLFMSLSAAGLNCPDL